MPGIRWVHPRIVIMQNAAVATGNGTAVSCESLGSLSVEVSIAGTATITFEARGEVGTWSTHGVINTDTQARVTTASASGLFVVPIAGIKEFRARISSWTSGAVTAKALRSNVEASPIVGSMALAAGEAHVGSIGKTIVAVTATPTVTAGAYSAGDAVGGLLTFANAVRVTGGNGTIVGVVITDKAAQSADLELVFFDQTFTATADNAEFDPSDADLLNCIGSIEVDVWSVFKDNAVGFENAEKIPIVLAGTSLFAQMKTEDTPTYASTSDLQVTIFIEQN